MNYGLFGLLLLFTVCGSGQPLPNGRSIFTLTRTFDAADVLLRSADIYTTHRNMTNPCGCFVEKDPIAPHTSSLGLEAGFLYGAGFAIIQSDLMASRSSIRWLRRSGRLLLLADLVSESIAIANNNTQRVPVRAIRAARAVGSTALP